MSGLSAAIITHNEERNIARCLQSVKDVADDIVVVDSFSTDSTPEICRRFNANLVQRQWEGYSAAKNFANQLAANDFILSIDADEALSEELQKEVSEVKNNRSADFYRINRLTNYCGKWVRHGGWSPDLKVRLFDRRKTRWVGLVHETLEGVKGEDAPVLKGFCYHYSYYTIEEHYNKADVFTTIAANELFESGRQVSAVKLIFSPAMRFVRDYFFRFGFLDGRTGYRIAGISAKATYWKYCKLKKLQSLHAGKQTA